MARLPSICCTGRTCEKLPARVVPKSSCLRLLPRRLAFDIIGDLAFGKPFGMLDSGEDLAPVQVQGSNKTEYLPAIQILNRRGEYSATLGVVPPFLRPFAKRLPFFKRGLAAVQRLAGIAIAAVNERLANPVERDDLLSKLQAGKDDQGNPMGKEELTAEALTQLIAGSDTTSNSSCAILYHLSHNRPAWNKLQAQLDDIAQGKGDFEHFEYDEVKDIEYLQACIDEGLRLHSTSAIGLPREVPKGGYEVLGRFYPGGTVLSVPVSRDSYLLGSSLLTGRPVIHDPPPSRGLG